MTILFHNMNLFMMTKITYNEIELFLKEDLEIKNVPHWHKRSKSKTIELTSKQKAKIYKMYKKDFELLNYEK